MKQSSKNSEQCDRSTEDIGVDLNRNYDFAFGRDNVGSNSNACADDFRGHKAFSEPATRQMKNFIENTPEGKSVRIALNLHAWGNMLVHPFSFLMEPIRAVEYKDNKHKNKLRLSEYMCHETIKN